MFPPQEGRRERRREGRREGGEGRKEGGGGREGRKEGGKEGRKDSLSASINPSFSLRSLHPLGVLLLLLCRSDQVNIKSVFTETELNIKSF